MLSSVPTTIELSSKSAFLDQFKYVTKHDMSEPDKVSYLIQEYAKHYYFDLYFNSQLYYAFLNNNSSEIAARMNAMENATKNAKEIYQKLTLKYNNAR